MKLQAGIRRRGEGIDGVHWNIMGQVYTPKSITEDCFSWHALLPPETFVPPHIHPTQDEYILVQSGALDLVLDGEDVHAQQGDLICMPRGIAPLDPSVPPGAQTIGPDRAETMTRR